MPAPATGPLRSDSSPRCFGIADGQTEPIWRRLRRSELASLLIKNGLLDSAEPIIAGLEDAESRFELLLSLADQQVLRGRRDTAIKTLEQAVADFTARPASDYIQFRLASLAALQAKLGLLDDAEQAVAGIRDNESRLKCESGSRTDQPRKRR